MEELTRSLKERKRLGVQKRKRGKRGLRVV